MIESISARTITLPRMTAGEVPTRPILGEETLFLDSEGQLKTLSGLTGGVEDVVEGGGSSAAHNLGSIGASASETLTLYLSNGSRQYGYVASAVNDLTIDTPVGTPAEMDEVNLVLQWTDGITLAFDAAIGIPSDSAISLPKTLTAWRSYRIKLEFFGGWWNLVSLVGGFVERLD